MSLRWLFPVLAIGLAACGSDSVETTSTASSAGAPSTESSATSAPTATDTTEPTTTAIAPLSLTFTFAGIDGLTPREEPQLTRSSDGDDTTTVWGSAAGITDAFLVLHDVATPSSGSPEGDVTADTLDVPSGSAWLVTDKGVGDPTRSSATRVMWWRSDGRLWVVSNFGLTPQRLTELTLAIQPGSGLPFVLADPTMSIVGLSTMNGYESARQGWSLDGSNLELAVTDGGLARQLDVTAVSVAERVVAGAAGYEITLPNGQVNLIWPTENADHWASVLISPLLASRVDEITAAIVPR